MHQLTFITQQALFLVLVVSAPPVMMSLMVGFIISVFQATTQIQEQTLSFAPKVVVGVRRAGARRPVDWQPAGALHLPRLRPLPGDDPDERLRGPRPG